MLCFPSLLYLLFKLNNCRCFISDHLFIYKIYNLFQQKMCISSTYITHQIKQKTRNSFFHLRFLLTKTIGNQRRRLLEKSRWKEYEIWKDFHIFSWKDLNNYRVVLYCTHVVNYCRCSKCFKTTLCLFCFYDLLNLKCS